VATAPWQADAFVLALAWLAPFARSAGKTLSKPKGK
jgi:hypothetical protein